MASWMLSVCCIRPLPEIYPISTDPLSSYPLKLRVSLKNKVWGVKVRASSWFPSPSTLEEDNNKNKSGKDNFDPGSPPPFSLADIRAAIPEHCWVKNPWKSMSYVVRDVVIVFGLAAIVAYFNNWLVWPLYWFAQGVMFWALFVLGHECGHGSFSNNLKLNTVVGHFLHSSILVPYHGWRISHKIHHQNHGHVEKDESWHPLSESLYKSMPIKEFRFTLPFPLLLFPIYLWKRSPGRKGSHFHPDSDLFAANERKDVITSTVCWSAMVAILVGLSFIMGPLQLLKLYGIPYVVFVVWLDFVVYLQHHGHEDKLPWYRGRNEAIFEEL